MIKELFGSLFWYRHVRGIQQRSITTTKKIRCPHLNRFWVVLYIYTQYIYTWTHSSHTSQVFAVLEIAAIHMAVGPFGKSSLWIMGWKNVKVSQNGGYPQFFIIHDRNFHEKPSSYWGTPVTKGNPQWCFPWFSHQNRWLRMDPTWRFHDHLLLFGRRRPKPSWSSRSSNVAMEKSNPPKTGGFNGKIDENRL